MTNFLLLSRRATLAVFLVLVSSAVVQAANWYVAPTQQGSHSGTSYANAWAPNQIVWGGGGVVAGDTINLDCGTTSNTYTTAIVIGADGSSGSPITIRASQDSGHNGTCIFEGGGGTGILLNGGGHNYITIDGQYQGQRHLVYRNNTQASNNPLIYFYGNAVTSGLHNKITYVTVTKSGIGMFFIYQSLGELSFLDVSDISCDAAIDMVGQPADGYGTGVELHHSTIQVNNQSGGNGPDAVQTSQGATVHDNVIYGATGTLCAAPNHQDGIQQGGDYHLIYNNVFYDLANSSFDSDWNSEPCGFMHAWNNIIAASSNHSTSGGIWVGEQSGCTHEEDVKIINNVFVGFSSVPALYIQNGLTSTIMSDTLIENNIFYDDGSPIEITNGNYNCTTDVIIDYNNVNAGTAGGTSLTCDGTSFSQAHGQSGAPVFVSYSLRNQSNDYHLQSNSAADIGKGVNLATPFPAALTDKDDVARPGNGGGAWDIGAYMYSDDPPPGPPEGLQADVR